MGVISRMTGLAVAGAVLISTSAAFGQQPAQRNITVALSSGSIGAAATRIVKEMGFFTKYNINASINIMENSGVAIAALLSGSADLAIAGSTELIVAHDRGQKLVAIATAYAGYPATLVLAKSAVDKLGVSPNAPVAERLKALDGLLLATPSPTAIGSVIMKGAALANGATIRYTYMAQPAMPAALETGAIQGFQAAAPAWVFPVVKGQAVVWLSGPKGDLPKEFSPIVSTQLQTTRAYAEANSALMKDIASAFADLAKAVEERPADVKATLGKLFPDLDPPTLDLVYNAESLGWKGKQATPEIMSHEINLAKSSGIPLPNAASLDPKAMLYP